MKIIIFRRNNIENQNKMHTINLFYFFQSNTRGQEIKTPQAQMFKDNKKKV